MEKIEVVFKIVRNVFWTILLQGIALLILGILIIFFPALLNYLISIVFIVLGILMIVLAFKIKKLSKFTIKL